MARSQGDGRRNRMGSALLRLRRWNGVAPSCGFLPIAAAALILAPTALGEPAPDPPPAGAIERPDPVGQPASTPGIARTSSPVSTGAPAQTAPVQPIVVQTTPSTTAARPETRRPRARAQEPAPRASKKSPARATKKPVRAAPQRPLFEPQRARAAAYVQTLAASVSDPSDSNAAALRASLALLVLVIASGALLVTARAWMEE